jgi:hypothetical protein
MIRVALPFSFLRPYQIIKERYLSINYIGKLEYYYVVQVYWEFADCCAQKAKHPKIAKN